MALGLRSRPAALILAAACACAPSLVRADEAYLCGPDTVVYVKPHELETLKRTDPCIAAYFGLKVEQPAQARVPVDRIGGAPDRKSTPTGRAPFKTLDAPETSERISRAPERSAHLMPPTAAPGTDFRNVRVINAASQDAQWFRHQR